MLEIEFSPAAAKFLECLVATRRPLADRIVHVVDSLRSDPFKGKKLSGDLALYRSLRVGDYRIIYIVMSKRVLIQVVSIGHRREIYR